MTYRNVKSKLSLSGKMNQFILRNVRDKGNMKESAHCGTHDLATINIRCSTQKDDARNTNRIGCPQNGTDIARILYAVKSDIERRYCSKGICMFMERVVISYLTLHYDKDALRRIRFGYGSKYRI